MLSLQDIQMKLRGPFCLTNMFHGGGSGIGKTRMWKLMKILGLDSIFYS